MAIPKEFTERYLSQAAGSRLFGVPLQELTRDEAVAAIVWLGEDLRRARDEHQSSLDLFRAFRARSSSA
jgi:hypothetical protein